MRIKYFLGLLCRTQYTCIIQCIKWGHIDPLYGHTAGSPAVSAGGDNYVGLAPFAVSSERLVGGCVGVDK